LSFLRKDIPLRIFQRGFLNVTSAVLACAKCGSNRIDKFGFLYLDSGQAKQRYVCKVCNNKFIKKTYNQNLPNENSQICVVQKGAKNLANTAKTKIAAFDKINTQKGQIIHFCFHLKKQGYAEATIKLRYSVLKVLMERGANLSDPETVKEVIARQSWSQNRKRNVISSYTKFLNYQGLSWNPPKCNGFGSFLLFQKKKKLMI